MIRDLEAERFVAKDESTCKCIEALNALSFAYGLKIQIGGQDGHGGKINYNENRKTLLTLTKEITEWIDSEGRLPWQRREEKLTEVSYPSEAC